ncbi:SRPBCC family protein [Roseateles toxinivorans]|uniref:Polyketide cyclase/dehydrase/lipid transport protein n=1 Tax=Roseateles toxinivorans TaxID=270368 RepID=A0A4R6QRQ1_9BURK|nr:SRPBCC family protein [Roseateles toxinivorans]TDP73987.1 polyketide cyclase/dehydrase/lipid transport protein [Roseateles toxinivorans]
MLMSKLAQRNLILKLEAAPVVTSVIAIARPAAEVFDFVSTPAHWSRWHPATRLVREAPERPLVLGETVLEHIGMVGRRFQARWTVCACEPVNRWAIATDTPHGVARITYLIVAEGTGCRFERRLQFRSKFWLWRLFDANLTRWVLEHQSSRALRRLKILLEAR